MVTYSLASALDGDVQSHWVREDGVGGVGWGGMVTYFVHSHRVMEGGG